MTTIFRDGRGFVPTTIFVPQFMDYHRDIQLDSRPLENTLQTHNADVSSQAMFDDMRSVAVATFQKLYKNDDSDTVSPIHTDSENDIFRMTFDQLAEKRLRSDAENDYNRFIAKREEKIRAEQKRLLDIEDYNRDFDEKLSEAKQRAADKKRTQEERLSFLKGLLLGDDYDPSIPRPTLCILQGVQAEFFKIWALKTYHIDAVHKISPVVFGYGGGVSPTA